MNGRIYDPLLGRFLSADILVDDVADLQGYNRYSYVKNRPLSLVDKTGFNSGYQFYQMTLQPQMFFQIAEKRGVAEAFQTMKTLNQSEAKGALAAGAILAGPAAITYVGGTVVEAAAAGNLFAQGTLAAAAAGGLIDGTQKMAEGAGEFSVNPSVDSAAKFVAGGLEAGLSVAGVASVRTALAEAPVVSNTAASTRTTTAADSADTPAPAVQRAEGEMVATRHHTDIDSGRQIVAGKAINPSRAADPLPPGVDVEVAPFGPANTASAELGAHKSGAYVEFSVPRSSLTPTPNITEAARNAARIVTDKPLPLTDPKLVNTKPWWAFWR